MSWNEIKVGLAPPSSKVYESRDRRTSALDGYPVTVLNVSPQTVDPDLAHKSKDVEDWLSTRGFSVVVRKPNTSRFRLHDIEILVGSEKAFLREAILNIKVGLDAETRLPVWTQFVKELCDRHYLRLIDPERGLVPAEEFEILVKQSFAWECFLERQK